MFVKEAACRGDIGRSEYDHGLRLPDELAIASCNGDDAPRCA
jgi:hypothetical protein